jgi:hypothetical protein
MWFLLLAAGAVVVQLAGVSTSRRLPVPPPPELLLAAWFLLATAVRLAVMRVRLAGFERKAKRLARRTGDQSASPIGELGLGVGRGALQAVGGDVLGATLSLVAALLRGAAHSLRVKPSPQRERRRQARRERLAAITCVLGIGLTCTAMAWWPLVGGQVTRAAAPTLRELGLMRDPPRPDPDRFLRRDTIGPAATPPAPAPGSR